MEGRHIPKLLHLRDGKIAYADCTDLPLLKQTAHRIRRFGDRRLRIGPVNLIDNRYDRSEDVSVTRRSPSGSGHGSRCGMGFPSFQSRPTLVAMTARSRKFVPAIALPTISSECPKP